MEWAIVDYCGNDIIINSIDDIVKTIDKYSEMNSNINPILTLVNDEGHQLSMGISKKIGFISYTGPNGVPNIASLGDSSLGRKDGLITFYCGENTQILLRHCIPMDILIDVVEHYYSTGELSPIIQWEEDFSNL